MDNETGIQRKSGACSKNNVELLPRASREISTSVPAAQTRETLQRKAKGDMEPSTDNSMRYFCHVCTSHVSHVSVRKTSSGELECIRCSQTFVEMVGPAAEDDTVRVDAMPSAATATAAATAATNPHVTSNRGSEDERVDALVESLLRGRQRQQQLPDSETISRMYSSVSGGDEAPGASSGGVIGRGSNSNSQDTRLGVRTDSTMASQTAAGETGVRFGDSDVSAPFSLGRDAVRARGSTSDAASTRRNDLWPGSDGVGSTSRVRRPRRVSERGTGSIDGGGGRDRDRRRGTPPIQTAVATAFIRDEMQASNADIANSVELVLEQLLVGGGLLPAGLLAGAVGGGGGQGRNATGVGDDDGGGNAEGGAGDGQVGARGHGGGGARAAATRGGGIGRRGARSGGPGRQMTLLEAIRAGGGRPPSQLTDVFIGPGMRVTGGGGGGGEGGITGVRLGNALGSGLGAFMRGFALAGGVGGAGGPGGNVGDYAFGDLSQLIQQLMAADPNRHGPPPASKEIVDALPTIQVAKGSRLEGTECAVCKDDFAAGETVRELPCTHAFHQHCILPWLAERNTCPTCRYELPTDENSTVNNIMSDMNGMNGILTSDDNGNVNDATADGRRGGGEGARGGAEGDAPRPGEDAAEATSWSLSPSLSGQGARRRSSGEEASTAFTFHDPPGAA